MKCLFEIISLCRKQVVVVQRRGWIEYNLRPQNEETVPKQQMSENLQDINNQNGIKFRKQIF